MHSEKAFRYTGSLGMSGLPGLPGMVALAGLVACLGSTGCQDVDGMDAKNPQRGPGELVGNGEPITDGNFPGGFDEPPAARATEPPTTKPILCDGECEAYCDSLGLTNPVNIGMCKSTWGVGIETQPIDRRQACRKLYVDMVGRYPTPAEINDVCSNEDWGETVKSLMATPEFVLVQQRRWADQLLYNNRITNVERIFDMDDLVRKAYQGYVPWDLFAAVTVSHPVLVRRYATPGDRAEAVFRLFLHRPPYESERSDMGRMFSVWSNGYRNHSYLGTVPDAYINYDCMGGGGNGDASAEDIGQCTSILWGYNQLILEPDERRESEGEQEGLMWSGYLSADEWEQLQLPGRVLAQQETFWEAAVDDVLNQYLGYDLGTEVQAVRFELKNYLLENAADIRAVHYAVATSVAYLQSSQGYDGSSFRWAFGPLKQAPAEVWIDSVKRTTGIKLGACDHRIPFPEDLLYDAEGNEMNGWTYALLNNSRWLINADRQVIRDYQYLAQTLGGCPSNEVSSRFTTVSILGTAVTEAFVAEVCDPALEGGGADASILLPEGMDRGRVLDSEVAQDIVARQTRLFYGREPTEFELEAAVGYSDQCTPKPCDAEHFARPVCFALLSGAEMIFY